MADRDTATGTLGLVQAYVNTADLTEGSEQLSDSNTLRDWLVAHGVMEPAAGADDSDVKHAVAVREAIRGIIGANTGGAVYPVDVATLNEAATASGLRARFGPDGRARLEPEVGAVVGAMGRIVAALFAGMGEDDWARLKLCSSPACRWVFYDRSRNHSSRWCTMATCGNREKARRFRAHARHS
jgi:predicted RNA-binding Zn ribbon-like protein